MGVINLRTGEQITYADGGSPDQTGASNLTIANSLAVLLGRRERGDYVWANSGERTSQTGMKEGDRGRQKDTKAEWLFTDGSWRLATPYIEFTGSNQTIPDAETYGIIGWSVDSTRSSDTTMVNQSVQPYGFTFVRAGIYFIQMRVAGATAAGLTMLSAETPPVEGIEVASYVGNVATFSTVYRTTADNTTLYVWHAGVAATLTGKRFRAVRLS